MSRQGRGRGIPALAIPDVKSENTRKSPVKSSLRVFSPRRRSPNLSDKNGKPSLLLSPRGNVDARSRSPEIAKSFNDDSMTYFAIYTSYAPLFRNLDDAKETLLMQLIESFQATCPTLNSVSKKFDFALPEDNYLCFYAPFSKMFDLRNALKRMDIVRVIGYSTITRYVNTETEETLIILNLICDEKKPAVEEEAQPTEEDKLSAVREKYALFLKAQGTTSSSTISSEVESMFSPRSDKSEVK